MALSQPANGAAVKMNCSLKLKENAIEIKYSVHNGSQENIYILDQQPQIQDRKERFDFKLIYLSHLKDSTAYLLQGIDPLPLLSDLYARSIPSSYILPFEKTLERTLVLPRPLKEQGTYDNANDAQEKLAVKITLLEIEVHYVLESQLTEKTKKQENIFYVRTKSIVQDRKSLRCSLKMKPVLLWKQPGNDFNRTQPGAKE